MLEFFSWLLQNKRDFLWVFLWWRSAIETVSFQSVLGVASRWFMSWNARWWWTKTGCGRRRRTKCPIWPLSSGKCPTNRWMTPTNAHSKRISPSTRVSRGQSQSVLPHKCWCNNVTSIITSITPYIVGLELFHNTFILVKFWKFDGFIAQFFRWFFCCWDLLLILQYQVQHVHARQQFLAKKIIKNIFNQSRIEKLLRKKLRSSCVVLLLSFVNKWSECAGLYNSIQWKNLKKMQFHIMKNACHVIRIRFSKHSIHLQKKVM